MGIGGQFGINWNHEKVLIHPQRPGNVACRRRGGIAKNHCGVARKWSVWVSAKEAKVFCDGPTLRFSVCNDDKHLFAQAILWTDDDDSLGRDRFNRLTYDWSFLMLNVNPDGKVTPGVDREYVLNPGTPGLYYAVENGWRTQTGLYDDSKGRGAIRYIKTDDGKRVRV